MSKNKKRVIAIYLPQFHPFKENNEWWGEGFTEWTNVTKAKPRFRGHWQPHLPADLGFYDLRLPEVREKQAEYARKYGINGFCYYHYWFNGHQLMERPVKEILAEGKPEFPFMLCWANENWTRAWDGGEKQILISQNYSREDDISHINYLIDHVFSDPRYIKVDGKPVFCIYRSSLFPDIKETISVWRKEAKKKGIELYLCRFETFNEYGSEHLTSGFDAAVEFQPQCTYGYLKRRFLFIRLLNQVCLKLWGKKMFPIKIKYKSYVEHQLKYEREKYKQYPCVTPMWDNSARRKYSFFAFVKSTPDLYQKWLKVVYERFIPFSKDENFVFINAWNEWAEGNHLEPDQKWGKKYLEATKKAIQFEIDEE